VEEEVEGAELLGERPAIHKDLNDSSGEQNKKRYRINVILVEERLLSMDCLAFCTCGIKYGEAFRAEG
jgi:hypothetical protein